MSKETDFQAASARGGDERAFTVLYERLAPALVTWASIRIQGPLRRKHDPEDLLQDVWWKALTHFATFDPAKGSFRAWIFTIANNAFLEHIRRARSPNPAVRGAGTLPPELGAELTSITSIAKRNEFAIKLSEFASDLPGEDAEILIRCGLEGAMVKDVAPLVGASPEAVKKRWQRLRARLREGSIWTDFLDDAGGA